MLNKCLRVLIVITFLTSLVIPIPKAQAGSLLGLPEPGTMVNLTPVYSPVLIKGLKVHPDNPFLFDFIIDPGDSQLTVDDLKLKAESNKLIKYFLAAMTVPEKDLWVNLSPYEKNRMIASNLAQTEMGRDMLAQDYILKQLTASLIYPEKNLGKTFWDEIYTKAQEEFGTTQIPVNTFNKVWIVADKADVFERANTAYVVGAHLKVMLDEDYLALQKHTAVHNDTNSIGANIVREIILPAIEKEVNSDKNFAPLRQMFYSMILASWYKTALKDAILTQVYGNQSKVRVGVNQENPKINDEIFNRYLRAYKKGVFNYIKEDIDKSNGESIPRKYFSGGEQIWGQIDHAQVVGSIPAGMRFSNNFFDATVSAIPVQKDRSMSAGLALEQQMSAREIFHLKFPFMGFLGSPKDLRVRGIPGRRIDEYFGGVREFLELVNSGQYSETLREVVLREYEEEIRRTGLLNQLPEFLQGGGELNDRHISRISEKDNSTELNEIDRVDIPLTPAEQGQIIDRMNIEPYTLAVAFSEKTIRYALEHGGILDLDTAKGRIPKGWRGMGIKVILSPFIAEFLDDRPSDNIAEVEDLDWLTIKKRALMRMFLGEDFLLELKLNSGSLLGAVQPFGGAYQTKDRSMSVSGTAGPAIATNANNNSTKIEVWLSKVGGIVDRSRLSKYEGTGTCLDTTNTKIWKIISPREACLLPEANFNEIDIPKEIKAKEREIAWSILQYAQSGFPEVRVTRTTALTVDETQARVLIGGIEDKKDIVLLFDEVINQAKKGSKEVSLGDRLGRVPAMYKKTISRESLIQRFGRKRGNEIFEFLSKEYFGKKDKNEGYPVKIKSPVEKLIKSEFRKEAADILSILQQAYDCPKTVISGHAPEVLPGFQGMNTDDLSKILKENPQVAVRVNDVFRVRFYDSQKGRFVNLLVFNKGAKEQGNFRLTPLGGGVQFLRGGFAFYRKNVDALIKILPEEDPRDVRVLIEGKNLAKMLEYLRRGVFIEKNGNRELFEELVQELQLFPSVPEAWVVPDRKRIPKWRMKPHYADTAMKAPTDGGIDFGRSKMQMNLTKEGQGVQMRFDPAIIASIKANGFDGLRFKIESIVRMPNLPVLLGLELSKLLFTI